MKQIISLLTAILIVCAALPGAAVYAEDAAVRLLAMGDSITDDYGATTSGTGSYRKYLYPQLTADGYAVNMVGSRSNWTDSCTSTIGGTEFTYDPAHDGYSGFTISSARNAAGSTRSGLLEQLQSSDTLAQNTPDIILLMIGTNDILDDNSIANMRTGLENLTRYIYSECPKVKLFIASPPPLDTSRVGSWMANYWTSEDIAADTDQKISDYEQAIAEIIHQLNGEGYTCEYVDMHSAFENPDGSNNYALLEDGCHPNLDGYAAMADRWKTVLENYLGNGTFQPETQPGVLPGDINLDGSHTVADIVLLQKYLLGLEPLTAGSDTYAELTGDKKINVLDLIMLKRLVFGNRK